MLMMSDDLVSRLKATFVDNRVPLPPGTHAWINPLPGRVLLWKTIAMGREDGAKIGREDGESTGWEEGGNIGFGGILHG